MKLLLVGVALFLAFGARKRRKLTGYVSDHFTWEELTTTSTGLTNNPNASEAAHLEWLAWNVLEPIRAAFGPVTVTSGFRTAAVNEAVGGAPDSYHLSGCAADIIVDEGSDALLRWIYDNGLPVVEVIVERHNGVLHVAGYDGADGRYASYLETSDGENFEDYFA